jgi:hypothetical protein
MSELDDPRGALKVSRDPNASMEDAARASALIAEINSELLEAIIAVVEAADDLDYGKGSIELTAALDALERGLGGE